LLCRVNLKKVSQSVVEVVTMKGYIVSILIVGLALGGMGLGTFAWFTDQESVKYNVIKTGTLDLEVQLLDANGEPVDKFEVENIHPGEWKNLGSITVTNIGTSDLKWKGWVEKTAWTDLPITFMIGEVGGKERPFTWAELADKDSTSLHPEVTNMVRSLVPGGSQEYSLKVKLDEDAGNVFKNTRMQFSFIFDATQDINPGWSETTV